MPPRVKNHAFDLRESQLAGTHADIESYEDLAGWLTNELETALSARGTIHEDIRYAWTLYEQGRTRGSNAPWPDAADLTSPFAAEYVDALHARAMQTIFQEPVWTVDGWGESAKRAPFVEEFHQRTQEEERLQGYLDDCLMRAWIEGVGILEVSEAVDLRRERKRIQAQLQLAENGAPILDEKNQPLYVTDDEGNPVEVQPQEGQEPPPSAEIELDRVEPVRTGPDYDVVAYLDFLTLPAHAKSRQQIWGYAKRFHRRVPELTARAALGIYDKKAVEALGTENERVTTTDEAPCGPIVADQSGPTSEKELWEVPFLADLDGKGERWYRATVSRDKRVLLRLKFDDRTTRYLRFIPFPIPGRADRGYSLVTHKLITVIEEDTAVRNMWADKAALAIAAPVKRMQGALWDPFEQPFGPRAVIDVRSQQEVEQMQLSDVPASFNAWRQSTRNDADRLAGQNDTSLGQSSDSATLGEVRLKAGYVEVRIDLIVKRLKEPLEELGQARHTIWKRVLQSRKDGLPIPQSMAMGLEARGVDMPGVSTDGRITYEMLDGVFWFKPRASVESADLNARMGYFNQFMIALANMAKVNQTVAMLMAAPPFAKSMLEEAMRVYRWQDKHALVGPEAQTVIQQQQQQMQMQQDPRMQFMQQMLEAGGGAPGVGMPPGGAPAAPPAPQAAGVM